MFLSITFLFVWILLVLRYISNIERRVQIVELLIIISSAQWIVVPIILINFGDILFFDLTFSFPITELKYLSYVLPATVLFYICIKSGFGRDYQDFKNPFLFKHPLIINQKMLII